MSDAKMNSINWQLFFYLSIGWMHQSLSPKRRYFRNERFRTMFKVKRRPCKLWIRRLLFIDWKWCKILIWRQENNDTLKIDTCIRSVEIDCNLQAITVVIINKVVYFPFQITKSHVITNDTGLVTHCSIKSDLWEKTWIHLDCWISN